MSHSPLIRLLLLILSLSFPTLGALFCDHLCRGGWECFGAIEAGGELIAFRPSSCRLVASVLDPTPVPLSADALPKGTAQTISPGYTVGFRVFAKYIFNRGCHDVGVALTRVHTSDTSQLLVPCGRVAWVAAGHPQDPKQLIGEAVSKATAKFAYDALTFDAAPYRQQRNSTFLRISTGLHLVVLEHRFTARYRRCLNQEVSFDRLVIHHRSCWGLGPVVIVDGHYRLWKCLSFSSRVMGGVVTGMWDGRSFQFNREPPAPERRLNVRYDHAPNGAPLFGARLGVRGESQMRWLRWNCEFGYEWLSYWSFLPRSTFNGRGGTQTFSCTNFSFDGFYLRLGFVL